MADDEQFSLCWNNFNTNLSAGFHESLLRGDLVDVTLAAEGQLVKAHRLILSVCSPYFRKMLTQVPATQHAFIFLKDVSHSALKDLIQFMYCGEVNVKQDALPAFISTAEALQIKGLTETGDSAPAQQSPAKEVIAAPPATISVPIATATGGSPRTKVQRTRVHSYKLESEESGDDKVQIQAGSSHHVTAQQVQQQTQHTTTQKRTLQQRTVIPIQPSKRTKLSVASVEALEAPEATPQVQTVQIVKQVLEPDYVEIPIESINAKAEPEYADETGEIETVETEAEQEHTLTEHEQSVEQEQADDDGNYVEDEYAEMGKFEESYFTEGEDAKAGASGFGDSYTSDGGTGTEQSAQANEKRAIFILNKNAQLQLMVNGQLFNKGKQVAGMDVWNCTMEKQFGCQAFVKTSLSHRERVVMISNKLHNHVMNEMEPRNTPLLVEERHHLKSTRESLRTKLQSIGRRNKLNRN
ncbi:modifier of mdg4-like isoform X11 [Anopheles ziemanni]|uniref:modifier of mdg4-like isoform X24 n=1 Tax=Anopheles coustani TaxID=139045 RepID=UPI0026593E9C|nr:modifier of mdg4-like isoform X24 [Anopheles coustani]XP_058170969.1 modifier of mdg4-like isoform X11 [Anopheles ziemanni]